MRCAVATCSGAAVHLHVPAEDVDCERPCPRVLALLLDTARVSKAFRSTQSPLCWGDIVETLQGLRSSAMHGYISCSSLTRSQQQT